MSFFTLKFISIRLSPLFLCALTFAAPLQAQVTLQDLQGSYHGSVFDAEGQEIIVDEDALAELYALLADEVGAESATPDFFREALAAVASQARSPTDEAQPDAVADIGQLDLLLSTALGTSQAETAPHPHRRTLQMLRALGGSRYSARALPEDPEVQDLVRDFRERNAYTHVRCTGDEMPVPPDFPVDVINGDDNWTSPQLITQDMTPIHKDTIYGYYPPTRIFFHESTNPKGLCTLLLRFNRLDHGSTEKKTLMLSGVICQSYNTKDTCFWENRRVVDGNNTPIKLEELAETPAYREITETWLNSASQTEDVHFFDTCTTCHSGQNAFVFYPYVLCPDPSEGSCYGAQNNDELIDPVGYGNPLNVKSEGIKERGCTSCHELALDSSGSRAGFCLMVRHVIRKDLMPPDNKSEFHAGTLYWKGPIPDDNRYKAAVMELRAFCPSILSQADGVE